MKDISEYDKFKYIDDFDKYLEDLRTKNKNFNDLINYEVINYLKYLKSLNPTKLDGYSDYIDSLRNYSKQLDIEELLNEPLLFKINNKLVYKKITNDVIDRAIEELKKEHRFICYETVFRRCKQNIIRNYTIEEYKTFIYDEKNLESKIIGDWNGLLINRYTGTIYDKDGYTYYQTRNNQTKSYNSNSYISRPRNKTIIINLINNLPDKNFYINLLLNLLNKDITVSRLFYIISNNNTKPLEYNNINNYANTINYLFEYLKSKYPRLTKEYIEYFKKTIIYEFSQVRIPLNEEDLANEKIYLNNEDKVGKTISKEEIEEIKDRLNDKREYICRYTVIREYKRIINEKSNVQSLKV